MQSALNNGSPLRLELLTRAVTMDQAFAIPNLLSMCVCVCVSFAQHEAVEPFEAAPSGNPAVAGVIARVLKHKLVFIETADAWRLVCQAAGSVAAQVGCVSTAMKMQGQIRLDIRMWWRPPMPSICTARRGVESNRAMG